MLGGQPAGLFCYDDVYFDDVHVRVLLSLSLLGPGRVFTRACGELVI